MVFLSVESELSGDLAEADAGRLDRYVSTLLPRFWILKPRQKWRQVHIKAEETFILWNDLCACFCTTYGTALRPVVVIGRVNTWKWAVWSILWLIAVIRFRKNINENPHVELWEAYKLDILSTVKDTEMPSSVWPGTMVRIYQPGAKRNILNI